MNIPNIPKHCEVETSKFFFSLAACLVIKKPPLIRRSPLRSQSSSAHQGGPPFTPSKLPSFGEISLQTLWKLEKLAPTKSEQASPNHLNQVLSTNHSFKFGGAFLYLSEGREYSLHILDCEIMRNARHASLVRNTSKFRCAICAAMPPQPTPRHQTHS